MFYILYDKTRKWDDLGLDIKRSIIFGCSSHYISKIWTARHVEKTLTISQNARIRGIDMGSYLELQDFDARHIGGFDEQIDYSAGSSRSELTKFTGWRDRVFVVVVG